MWTCKWSLLNLWQIPLLPVVTSPQLISDFSYSCGGYSNFHTSCVSLQMSISHPFLTLGLLWHLCGLQAEPQSPGSNSTGDKAHLVWNASQLFKSAHLSGCVFWVVFYTHLWDSGLNQSLNDACYIGYPCSPASLLFPGISSWENCTQVLISNDTFWKIEMWSLVWGVNLDVRMGFWTWLTGQTTTRTPLVVSGEGIASDTLSWHGA